VRSDGEFEAVVPEGDERQERAEADIVGEYQRRAGADLRVGHVHRPEHQRADTDKQPGAAGAKSEGLQEVAAEEQFLGAGCRVVSIRMTGSIVSHCRGWDVRW